MPEYEEVKQALRDASKLGSKKEAARVQLAQWGDAALPHLRTMVQSPLDKMLSMILIRAISTINSSESTELLIEVLEGKTQFKPTEVVLHLPILIGGPHSPSRITKHPRFKAAYLALDLSGSFLSQSGLAQIASRLGWTDVIPTLRKMLEHEHLSTREAAAQALHSLTGEEHQPERPPVLFPRTEYRAGLLGIPRVQEREPATRGILQLQVRGAQDQTVMLASNSSFGRASHAVSIDSKGQELWSFKPDSSFAGNETLALLADKYGPYGVALGPGGEEGIIAVGPSGKTLWDVPKLYVTYGLSAHSQLPGLLLHIGGECKLFEHDASGARPIETKDWAPKPRTYVGEAVLFPDEFGAPSFIVQGSGAEPAIQRHCTNSLARWSAVVPSRICGLTMIEADSSRLFSAVTDAGEVFVFNAEGTLLSMATIPGLDPGGHSVCEINARRVKGDDHWLLEIELTGSTYEIDVDI